MGKRGGFYLKLYVLSDAKTGRIISFRITRVSVHDTRKLPPMLKELAKAKKVQGFYADAAYDSQKSFPLKDNDIESAIRIRRNARTRSLGSPTRRAEAVLLRGHGLEGWKRLKGYNKR